MARRHEQYEPYELIRCFQFIRVERVHSAATWWPCLRFRNLELLDFVTIEWKLCNNTGVPARCCPSDLDLQSVAFLFGDSPPQRYLFDLDPSANKQLTFLPFLTNLVSFTLQYNDDQEFLQAVTLATEVLESKLTRVSHSPLPPAILPEQKCPPESQFGESKLLENIKHTPVKTSEEETTSTKEVENAGSLALSRTNEYDPMPSASSGASKPRKRASNKSEGAESTPKKAKACPKEPIEVEIVEFADVKSILECGGYAFPSVGNGDVSIYNRPCGMSFASLELFRDDLCAYGVSCQCGDSGDLNDDTPCQCWDEYQRWMIRRWVRFNVIRGPRKSGRANRIPPNKFMTRAKKLGCTHFQSELRDGFKLPCVKNPAEGVLGFTVFRTWLDFILFLSRFGFPLDSTFDAVSDDEIFDLEVFLATYDRGTLYVLKQYWRCTCGRNSRLATYPALPIAVNRFPETRRLWQVPVRNRGGLT
jgi:hypothetical protein